MFQIKNRWKRAELCYYLDKISNYEELKELQEKAYKYEKTKYGDINDGQKLALTSEQFIDNKRLKKNHHG